MPPLTLRRSTPVAPLLLALAIALLCPLAHAQGHGGPGGPGGPGGGGMGGGSPFGGAGTMGNGAFPQAQTQRTGPPPASNDIQSTMRGGLQLGPPGRWWDDGKFARSLGLDSRQQQRMDDVFSANKGTILKLFKSYQHEESQLDKATRMKNPDEAQIFQQIDRVTAARGEAEKAYAHMELEIRKEMTPEQIGRLEDHRPAAQ